MITVGDVLLETQYFSSTLLTVALTRCLRNASKLVNSPSKDLIGFCTDFCIRYPALFQLGHLCFLPVLF